MEILEIRTTADLRARSIGARAPGAHTYHVNCRQFSTLHRQWQNNRTRHAEPLSVMTLDFEQIWMTAAEGAQVAAAIKETVPLLALNRDSASD
ncbi:MAG: hypothetical protein HY741_06010 [Chloroflexi bacterium]|nr:hypothetical protein [Chloroflexota bacterium]